MQSTISHRIMRRVFVLALSAVLFPLFSSPARAQSNQVHFGVKGGLTINEFSFSNDVFNSDNKTGFFVGPTFTFGVPFFGLGAELSFLFCQKDMTVETAVDSHVITKNPGEPVKAMSLDNFPKVRKTITQKTLDVPINISYSLGFSETACIYAFAGPQFTFALGDNALSFKDNDLRDVDWKLRDTAFSFNVGGGIVINHLQLSANYNVPIGKTGEFSWSDTTDKVFHADSKSKGWRIAAAYFF